MSRNHSASEKPRRGRPPGTGIGTMRVNVTLDAATRERLRAIGGGNVSEGIRIAAAAHPHHLPPPSSKT